MWFFSEPARVLLEKERVAALLARSDWLGDIAWAFDEKSRLTIKFVITIGAKRFPLKLTYPALFPFTPPDVAPIDPKLRLSTHQYGGGGLCLEHRPDNWQPNVTGADMIESAWRLLSSENPVEGEPVRVPSDHKITIGQEFRAERDRFLITEEWRAFLAGLDEVKPARVEANLYFHGRTWTALAMKVVDSAGQTIFEPALPKLGAAYNGAVIRVTDEMFTHAKSSEFAMAMRALSKAFLRIPEPAYHDCEFIIITNGNQSCLHWQLSPKSEALVLFAGLDVGGPDTSRIEPRYAVLEERKVAIVGCGSVGSKIAASLVRSGVVNLVLVDDDVVMRGNMPRNDLDWRDVGEHKVDAVTRRLRMINPEVSVDADRVRLSGQELAASADAALTEIATCDLVIDATADPNVFNLLAAVVRQSKKPMVWVEVFEGGIGGLVARSRPGLDPAPEVMRAGLLSWCDAQGVCWLGATAGDYAATDTSKSPLGKPAPIMP